MKDGKTLEEAIFTGFFQRLKRLPDFSREVLERFQQLQDESQFEDPERVLHALREGTKEHGRKPNPAS